MLPPWGPFTLWYPGLNWVAAPQVALGMWMGLHPGPLAPDWFAQGPVPGPAPGPAPPAGAGAPAAGAPEPAAPGPVAAPGWMMGPLGPGVPYGLGLGTTTGFPGAPVGSLLGQGGPVGPGQTLQWLATHYVPATIPGAQPLGPIFGSGIGLPGMPISAGSVGAGGRPITPGGIGAAGGGSNVGGPGIAR